MTYVYSSIYLLTLLIECMQRDALIPTEFPLKAGKEGARLRLRTVYHDLRVCTSELYLGALTSKKQLTFFSCVDLNTFDEDLVCEWTEEVKEAALYYLTSRNPELKIDEMHRARL